MNTVSAVSSIPSPRVSLGNVSWFEINFIVLGGLVLFLPMLMMMGEHTLNSTKPIQWYFWINATISAPHVFSSFVRLSRKIDEKKVHAYWGLPLYIVIVVALAILTITGHYLQTLTAINVWQSFHYLRQTYGVSRIYSKSAGDATQLARDLSFFAYHLAMPLFVLGRWNLLFVVWHGVSSEVIIPVRIPDPVLAICVLMAVAGFCLGVYAEWLRMRQPVYNPIGLIMLVAYYGIFWFGFLSPTFYSRGFFAVTIFHAVQYLALVWWFERKSEHSHGLWAKVWKCQSTAVAFLGFWIALFFVSYLYQVQFATFMDMFWPTKMAAILLGAISAHHYAIDTFMWRAKAGK